MIVINSICNLENYIFFGLARSKIKNLQAKNFFLFYSETTIFIKYPLEKMFTI